MKEPPEQGHLSEAERGLRAVALGALLGLVLALLARGSRRAYPVS